ncbi:hypothetical protein GQ42DRAFT_161355 [Ramicandelaber brevisporus]|nr:hypothetical protein GQ42DRAFT_161355 [Ramicandelaber brevisporus]
MPALPPVSKKLVIVGDGACGKTSLLIVFKGGQFPTNHLPTVFESSVVDVTVGNDRVVELNLWDSAGQEEYRSLRTLCYPDTDVVLICYSIDNPDSYDNVKSLWYPDISHFCRGVPYVLVACKSDIRNNPAAIEEMRRAGAQRDQPITKEEGQRLANEIGAKAFIECSALANFNVQRVFETAARLALAKGGDSTPSGCCVIL